LSAPDPPRHRHRLRKVLVGIAIGLASIVLLVVAALGVVLYTEAGTKKALQTFVAWYDGRVPGHVEIGQIEGSLAGGLTLHDLRLADAEDRPLVLAHRLELELRVLPLLALTVEARYIDALGLQIHQWPEPGVWGDLAPADRPPPPPDEPPGPNLPVTIDAPLTVDGLQVFTHAGGTERALVDRGRVAVQLHAAGRDASALLQELSARVGEDGHVLAAATGTVRWSSPELSVERFSAISDVALVERFEAWIDTQDPAWWIELDAVPMPASLGVKAVPPTVLALRGRGSFEAARAQVHALAPGLLDLTVEAGATFEGDVITATALGSGTLVAEAAFDGAAPLRTGPRPVAFLAGAHRSDAGLRASAALVSESLLATASVEGEVIDALVLAPGARVDGRARLQDGALRHGEVVAEVSSLSRLRAEIDPLLVADLPDARGVLSARASCERAPDAALSCEAAVDGRDLGLGDTRVAALEVRGHATPGADPLKFDAAVRADEIVAGGTTIDSVLVDAAGTADTLAVAIDARRGRDHVRASATVMPGPDPTVVALERLEARVKGRAVATRRSAWIALHDGAVDVDGLDLNVAGGRLSVQGRAAWEGRSDLEVSARRLDLGIARDFAPALRLAGRLDANVELRGDARSPTLHADLAARRLVFRGEPLGDLWLRAEYERESAQLDLSWADRGAAARVRAEVPVAIDLQARRAELKPRGELMASVDLHAVPLDRVAEWVGGPELEGSLDATVRAHGTSRAPLVAASVTAAHLQLDERELGNVELHATWDGKRVDAFGTASGRLVRRAEVSASIPLVLDARRTKVELDESAPHRVALVVRGADLSAASREEGALAGRVDLDLTAEADAGRIEGTARVLGRELVVRGREIGAAELVARIDPRAFEAHLQMGGTYARLLEAHAEVPIDVGGPLGPFAVRPDDELVAWVEMRDVDLALLREVASDGSLAGDASGRVAIDGSLRAPRIGVELDAGRLAARGTDLGRARVEAFYAAGEASAEVHQARGWQSLDLVAKAPVRLDLAARDVAWDRDGPHEIDLAMKGVDRALLEPFYELPPSVDLALAARLKARGTIEEPRARADVRASLSMEGAPPTPVAMHLEIEPKEQYARVLLGGHGGPDLSIEARTDASLPALLAGGDALDDVTLVASADTNGLDLRELAPVVPGQVHEPTGTLLLHARAVGPLRRPALSGEIAIDDGAGTIVAVNQRFKAIKLRASLDGPQIRLDELRMRSGNGAVSAEGYLQVGRGNTRGEAIVVSSRLPVLRPGVPLMRVDGRLDVDLDATGKLTEIDVRLNDGFVDVIGPKLIDRPDPIPKDDGVVYVDARGKRALEKETAKAAKGEPWMPADMALTFEIVEPLRIRGNQVDMDWDGSVAVRREPGKKPEATGAFASEGGRVSFLGNDFDITRGEVRLPDDGELDPYVDIVATTETPEAEVSLAISGRASRPTLAMSSSPALPEDQIFALLVTGETSPAGEGAGNDEFAAKAAGVLAAFQNPALQQALRDRVGVDRVGVSFGESVDQPVVVVGKRVTRDLYVETGYHHNAPRGENNAELRVEYQFTERWSVDTFFGDAAQGGVGVWWTRRFGKTGPPPPKREAKAKGVRRRKSTAKR
jgi:autotransporter translocation and assembly factor TamB